MRRKLSAIEIAEGALLADIAVIFQLLSIYLPIVGLLFRPLVAIVFALLVLRRNLYTAIMSLFVAIFLVGVMTGPHFLATMLFIGGGGLFFGVAMKRRMRHLPLLLIGITIYALGHYILTFLLIFLVGLPLKDIFLLLHTANVTAASGLNFIAVHVGLGHWWQHSAYPAIKPVAKLSLTYWWILLFIYYWFTLWPTLISLYLATNIFVRLLGHDVRPFLSGKLVVVNRPPRRYKSDSTLDDKQLLNQNAQRQEVQI